MRWILKIGLFCLLSGLATKPSSAEEAITSSRFHVGIGSGVGLSYDGLGLRLELRKTHWAASIGLGLDALPSTDHLSGGTLQRGFFNSFGLAGRWFSQDGRGWMISLSVMGSWDSFQSPFLPPHHADNQHFHIAPTVGYRWRWTHFFMEASAGPIINYEFTYENVDEPSVAYPSKGWSVGLGNNPSNTGNFWFFPTLEVGLGWEF